MSESSSATLAVFSEEEYSRTKILLATQVAHMMGRKLEEDDWNKVYCAAKGIPHSGWSNLNIDVNHKGLGVEQKLLRVPGLRGRPIKSVCGTTMMHPAATRSIRIDDTSLPADVVMQDVFKQYSELIDMRTEKVRETSGGIEPNMRIGWLLWEDSLTEFLYFEERLKAPQADRYFSEWNETLSKGARIYEKDTNKKRFSVTTSAGIKIQPYFDVPAPSDSNLYYFRVQSEPIDYDTVQIWVSSTTAKAIQRELGSLEKENISSAIIKAAKLTSLEEASIDASEELAQPIQISRKAFEIFEATWEGVSDEHRAQLFLEALHENS
ncbi:hypothetical protein [Candidatus Thiosymbion oneisti]|uniref:hypothetical protein n=1 Tax=Candidatus Thiosymbion oneisti TaxID=589554 RepID=UPI000AA737B2|nr:hypothetical protein [Candidatus Thiosymbion oneisti]